MRKLRQFSDGLKTFNKNIYELRRDIQDIVNGRLRLTTDVEIFKEDVDKILINLSEVNYYRTDSLFHWAGIYNPNLKVAKTLLSHIIENSYERDKIFTSYFEGFFRRTNVEDRLEIIKICVKELNKRDIITDICSLILNVIQYCNPNDFNPNDVNFEEILLRIIKTVSNHKDNAENIMKSVVNVIRKFTFNHNILPNVYIGPLSNFYRNKPFDELRFFDFIDFLRLIIIHDHITPKTVFENNAEYFIPVDINTSHNLQGKLFKYACDNLTQKSEQLFKYALYYLENYRFVITDDMKPCIDKISSLQAMTVNKIPLELQRRTKTFLYGSRKKS